jgi:hypothetical protein
MSCTHQEISGFFKTLLYLILILLISPDLIISQVRQKKTVHPSEHQEVKDNDFVPVLRETQQRSPAYNYKMSTITTKQVNVDENGLNIVGDAANETSIAIDPNNHNRMAIGWRQFNTINSNFRQAGYGFTTDGGETWTFPGVIEPGVFRSDPVLRSDVHGNFYYNSLTSQGSLFSCQVFKSVSGGSTWSNGVMAHGGDKQWMAIDNTNGPGNGNIYAYWSSFFSSCYPGFFTRSTNGGLSFEDCLEIPEEPYWGTIAIGPLGELYIAGTIGYDFLVAKSLNAKYPNQTPVWSTATVVDLDGVISIGTGPNPAGIAGQTQIAVDTSGGTYNGNVYLLCSVERKFTPDSLDIMFSRSTNGGVSWSPPKKINDDTDTSAFQWFGTMSVAPNGRIDVAWLDTRDNPGTYLSALYYSFSNDGGTTWSPNERLSDFFDPHLGWPQQNKMGDYFDMISGNSGAYLAWAGTFNGEQDVYFSYIIPAVVPVELLSFTASSEGGTVTLEWSTATELNNRGFEINRSTDRINWSTIGFKGGKGTTSEPQHYIYSDQFSGSESKLYYRLKQVDFNGSYEYSEILEVNSSPSEFILSQNYPNPFNPVTSIVYDLPSNGFVTLKIYDVLGNETASLVNQQQQAGKYNVQFNAFGLGTGVYFYTLRSGSYTATKKMILMK